MKLTNQKAYEYLSDCMQRINSADFSNPVKVDMEKGKYTWKVPCTHPSIATDGGGDYCKICGYRWER